MATTTSTTTVEDEEFDIKPWTPPELTPSALKSIEERQLCHQITSAGGPHKPCSHGFPQAFVFHPSKRVLNSGLFRLSCPLLVKAVDEYEAAGEWWWEDSRQLLLSLCV